VYALLVGVCEVLGSRLGVLRTFGQNPLIAYLLQMHLGGTISSLWPAGGGWPVAFAGMTVRVAVEYLLVRLLEWKRIFLRL
jgi:hypothetical protein